MINHGRQTYADIFKNFEEHYSTNGCHVCKEVKGGLELLTKTAAKSTGLEQVIKTKSGSNSKRTHKQTKYHHPIRVSRSVRQGHVN